MSFGIWLNTVLNRKANSQVEQNSKYKLIYYTKNCIRYLFNFTADPLRVARKHRLPHGDP